MKIRNCLACFRLPDFRFLLFSGHFRAFARVHRVEKHRIRQDYASQDIDTMPLETLNKYENTCSDGILCTKIMKGKLIVGWKVAMCIALRERIVAILYQNPTK